MMFLARSSNGGDTWASCGPPDHRLDPPDHGFEVTMEVYGSGTDGHSVYIAYFDEGGGDHLLFARNDDFGSLPWGFPEDPVTIVDQSSARVGIQPDMRLSDDGQTVYLSYIDSTNTDVRFARSDDAGDTWEHTVTVADTGTLENATHTDLAVFEAGIDGEDSVVVITYHNGTDDSLRFIRSDDNGETW